MTRGTTKPNGNDGSAEVMSCALAFVDALKSTPLVRHYQAAERQFRTHPEVQSLLADLRRRSEAFRREQEAGTLRREQIEELRDRQSLFQTHPVVQNFREAQQSVGMLFEETNAIVSKIWALILAKITVAPGTIVRDPVHSCFGVIPKEGLQEIISEFEIGEGANGTFFAHCSFPNAVKVKHVMDAKIHVGRRAQMTYSETHFHGEDGGVEVLPVAKIVVEEGGIFKNLFKLIKGAAGEVHLQYLAELQKNAVGELDAKIYGKKHDKITVQESLYLNGENARGLAKSRIVASDHCESEVIGEAVGNAPNARGHVDCVEIIKGKDARASAIPRLLVVDDRAKLTHEAAIGSVDKKQVETLMARGLTEDQGCGCGRQGHAALVKDSCSEGFCCWNSPLCRWLVDRP
jgi:Fe-S cluster assembly scaffold protein SufB